MPRMSLDIIIQKNVQHAAINKDKNIHRKYLLVSQTRNMLESY